MAPLHVARLYGTEQLTPPWRRAAIQSGTTVSLENISLRGNPKESVKHKSNNNGCLWRDGIVIVVFVNSPRLRRFQEFRGVLLHLPFLRGVRKDTW